MTDEKIDETTTQMLTENGDKEDGSPNNSVSDGEIIEDDELEEKKSPLLTLSTKVPKNFRSRNDNSESEDEIERSGGPLSSSGKSMSIRQNGNQPLNKNDLERLRKERKEIIDELGRTNVSNDRKPTHARHSFDGNKMPHQNDGRSGFRKSFNDQPWRNNFHNRHPNMRGNFHRSGMNGNSRPRPDEFKMDEAHNHQNYIIKYTKALPSIQYGIPKREVHRGQDPRRRSKNRDERIQKSRSRSREKSNRKHRKSEKSESPSKKSRNTTKTSPPSSDKSKEEKVCSVDENLKTLDEKIEKKEEIKTESSNNEENLVELKKCVVDVSAKIVEKSPEKSGLVETKESSPDLDIISKEIDSIFERSKFTKIELKIEKKKSPKRLEKPKVNIFLEDSDEVDEFEKVSFEVKSKWSSPVRPIKEKCAEKVDSVTLVPTQISEVKKVSHPAIPEVVESPERSPILSAEDNIFTIAKSPSPPPKPNPSVRNVCSFLSDIADGNFFSDFLSNDNDGLNLNSYKSESLNMNSHVEPDTTVVKSVDKNSDDDDDSDSDSDDSDSSETSSSSDSDTTSSSSSESEESEETDEDEVQTFSGFGTFNSSTMPMVQQIKPISTPSTPASMTSLIVSPRIPTPTAIIKPGIVPLKPSLYTTPPKTLPMAQTAFQIPPQFGVIGGVQGIPVPFKIYSLRDAAVYTPPMTPVSIASTPTTPTPTNEKEKEKDKKLNEKEKTTERRDKDKKRSRSRSLSRDRDRKRAKDERKRSPKRKSPSPIRKRHVDDRKDSRRRDDDRKREIHRSSTIRKRKSRSRSPRAARSPIARSKSPRPRTPPPKSRRTSPIRRSFSKSPPPKYRRSCSPRRRSKSPNHRRASPRRSRYSRSPNRKRRTPSPDHRYDRRSYSPTFRNKMESPSGYKPDSTISDTELERQQQQQQQQLHDEYYSQWNNQNSPRRQTLDDRINHMLTDSPTQQQQQQPQNQQQYLGYPSESYPYDNQMYQHEMYGMYDEYGNYETSRNYINNSNLVEITQQKRERQRLESSQVAVQVGNVLQIVPSKNVAASESEKPKQVSSADKRMQTKLKRKMARERKRQEKAKRKDRLRQEIQKYFDSGVTVDHSDDEELVPLRQVNILAVADKSILCKSKDLQIKKKERKVLFKDGILPGESTSGDDTENLPNSSINKQKRKKFRKKRLVQLIKSQRLNGKLESDEILNDVDLDKLSPPIPPNDSPPPHLLQPRLKKITPEMFAAFPVNPEPMYYYIEKVKLAQVAQQQQQQHPNNGYHHNQPQPVPPPPRGQNERFSYYKKPPPPQNIGQSPNFMHQQNQQQMHHQQRNLMQRPPPQNSVSSLDPRINQQRAAEKTFA